MIFLREIRRRNEKNGDEEYPMSVPAIQKLEPLYFDNPITILAGDNGCGKTTLVEIMAAILDANRVGYAAMETDKLRQIQECQREFLLTRSEKAKKNFYFSGEEFIRYVDWVQQSKADAKKAIAEIEEDFSGSDYAKALAKTPHLRTLGELNQLYANDLAKQSHGQGYLDFFSGRITPRGLYLLDEPESALSYENQYVLALMILEAIEQECQFIIATHSPILCGIPGADIREFQNDKIVKTVYEELDNVKFLRMFMRNGNQMFRHFKEN